MRFLPQLSIFMEFPHYFWRGNKNWKFKLNFPDEKLRFAVVCSCEQKYSRSLNKSLHSTQHLLSWLWWHSRNYGILVPFLDASNSHIICQASLGPISGKKYSFDTLSRKVQGSTFWVFFFSKIQSNDSRKLLRAKFENSVF